MEQFDTLPIQCRHIEHMHEGVFTEIFFSKLKSAGLIYNLPSFCTDSYCAGGGGGWGGGGGGEGGGLRLVVFNNDSLY